MNTTRRSFIQQTGLLAASALGTAHAFSASALQYKAAVIGRTGGGNYGHGLDTIFNDLDNVTVAAVADENPEGLKKAQERSGAKRAYADYREMLKKERPDIVSIAPRQPDCHRDMALAAIEAGAHIYMEKPITEYPAEADDILNAAKAKGLKIAVAHTRRFMDCFLRMKKLLDDGYLGEILEVRFQGKTGRPHGRRGSDRARFARHGYHAILLGRPAVVLRVGLRQRGATSPPPTFARGLASPIRWRATPSTPTTSSITTSNAIGVR